METSLIRSLIGKINYELDRYNNEFDNYISETRNNKEADSSFFEPSYEQLEAIGSVINRCFITLFDLTNSVQTLLDYRSIINDRYRRRDELVSGTYIEIADMYISNLASDWWGFIVPYNSLISDRANTNYSDHSRVILEKLLEETNALCIITKTQPHSEPQVYNAVKKYINLLFPRSKNIAGQSFPSIIKVYKPDIYVPECNAVVEYKYIDKETKIITALEGIADDVKGYKANSDYQYFYAVFYFTHPFIPSQRFNEIWKEKKFPKNWKYFYCIETN